MSWWVFALVGAVAASATAILAKLGVEGVPSNLATAVRTGVVLVFAWGLALASGQTAALAGLSARSLAFLGLSGLATGVSWLAYFRALSLAPASRVAPLDKVSLALTVVLAGLVLGETIAWQVGLGAAMIVGGALLTLPRASDQAIGQPGSRQASGGDQTTSARGAWWVYALVSAGAAAATAILAKIGIDGVPSNLATALRTVVVLVFAWSIVFARGEQRALGTIARRSMVFLVLSGLGTGVSWLAYYHALALAPASSVAPVDKASLALTILLAAVILREKVTPRAAVGVALQIAGALMTLGGSA